MRKSRFVSRSLIATAGPPALAIGFATAGLFASCSQPPPDSPTGAGRLSPSSENLDKAAAPAASTAPTVSAAPAVLDRFVAHSKAAFGAPSLSFLGGELDLPRGATATDAAWQTLRQIGKGQRLDINTLASARLAAVHDAGTGPVIARFEQRVDDIEIFLGGVSIALDRANRPLSATGSLAAMVRPVSRDFGADARLAVVTAYREMTGGQIAVDSLPAANGATDAGGYQFLTVPETVVNNDVPMAAGTARAKKVWFAQPGGLLPAYYVELDVGQRDRTDSALNSFVISTEGKILYRHDMVQSDSYTYRVWADTNGKFTPWDNPQGTDYTPHPTGLRDGKSPTIKPSNLVMLANSPFSKNDPWLPAAATEAKGNNVWAYANLKAPDGYSAGDQAVYPTAPGVFDRTYDLANPPQGTPDDIQAVTTNLFFTINWMHDSFYDAGYDEKSGNAQQDNFGRGGMGGDPVKAESQDYSGRNNANASTPADGSSPRIQMYLWDASKKNLKVTDPAADAGDYVATAATFGPATFNFTGNLLIVDDGVGTTDDGCETPFMNAAALAGKIAVISRGTCNFTVKVANAQANNAKGVLIVNNAAGLPPDPLGGTPPSPITIPTLGISKEDGDKLRTTLMGGTSVTVILTAAKLPDRDGTLDVTISSHEWGHTLSNRLVGNGNGLGSHQAGGMGEGWSDFVALVTISRPEDAMVAANAKWNGVYPLGAHVLAGNFAFYDGIRRYPYSADMTKNPLTFKHIARGTALPTTPVPAFGADGSNNDEVHNTGEVWTSMLWECYTALLRDGRYTFDQAQTQMRKYLVTAFKMTPLNPTFLEARDAVLAAAYATEPKDFALFWAGFAKRGAGIGAIGPDRGSADNNTVKESFAVGNDLVYLSATVDDKVKSCDNDGVLDNGETGNVTVKIRNVGAGSLTATTVTVKSDNPAILFPDGPTVTFQKIDPYQAGTATVKIAMRKAMPIAPYNLTLEFSDPSLAMPRTISATLAMVGNYDDAAMTSAKDDANAPTTVWSMAGDAKLSPAAPWSHNFEGSNGFWHIDDTDLPSDQYLVTPPLHVAMDQNFSFTFKHRYSFEAQSIFGITQYADGGVLEISTDMGMTWTDIGAQITMGGYNATLYNGNQSLPNRKAFGGDSANYPADYLTTTVDLATAYKGMTVMVRFRMATDEGTGAPGWDVDDIAFTGITDKPFSSRVANRMMCQNHAPVANAGQDQTVMPGDTVNLHGSGTDADQDPLTFRWTQTAGAMVMLDNPTITGPKFTAPATTDPIVLTFSLVANDGTVDSAPSTVNITVQPAPVVSPDGGNGGGGSGCSCQVGQAGGHGPGAPGLGLFAGLGLLGLLGVRSRRRRA